ncbi:MAG: oxidoreductase, partial [Rickettsia conorii subsp. raoultii]
MSMVQRLYLRLAPLLNVQRIIHISALGIDDEKNTAYALTKKAAEAYLQKLENIDWVILQPSLVYASGCYGGTSLFRALATLPYFIPLIGDGLQYFQSIHIDDLTKVIIHCIEREGKIHTLLKIVGPDIVTMKDIL